MTTKPGLQNGEVNFIITVLRTAGLKEPYNVFTQAVSMKVANLIYVKKLNYYLIIKQLFYPACLGQSTKQIIQLGVV